MKNSLKYIEDNSYPINQYFIISFKKTLLIINQSQINFLHSLFSKNPNVKFCILSDCQNILIQNYQNQINQIQCDKIFNQEITSFKRRIRINRLSINSISKNVF